MQNQPSIINGSVVRKETPYKSLIPTIEDAFRAYSDGNADMPEKSYVDVSKYDGDFRSMPSYVDAEDWEASGVKWVNVHPNNTELPTVMGTFVYTDPSTGEPVALMDGTEMTKRRTAAVSALAADYLAPESSSTLGILGAGSQSYEQIRAISTIRDIQEILVSDLDQSAVRNFKETFHSEFSIDNVPPSGLSRADIVCTLTPSTSPVIESLDGVSHINAMGADAPEKQELHHTILQDSNVILDDWDQCIHSGEVSKPYSSGKISRSDISATLGEVVSREPTDTTNRTLFDSTGLAIQDVATAQLVVSNIDLSEHDKANLFTM